MTFWAGVFSPPAKKRITQVEQRDDPKTIATEFLNETSQNNASENPVQVDDDENDGTIVKTPGQDRSTNKIAELNKQLVSLTAIQSSGLSSITKKDVDKVREQLHREQLNLKR